MKKTIKIIKLTKGLTFEKSNVFPTFTSELEEAFKEELKDISKQFEKSDAGDELEMTISFSKKEKGRK